MSEGGGALATWARSLPRATVPGRLYFVDASGRPVGDPVPVNPVGLSGDGPWVARWALAPPPAPGLRAAWSP